MFGTYIWILPLVHDLRRARMSIVYLSPRFLHPTMAILLSKIKSVTKFLTPPKTLALTLESDVNMSQMHFLHFTFATQVHIKPLNDKMGKGRQPPIGGLKKCVIELHWGSNLDWVIASLGLSSLSLSDLDLVLFTEVNVQWSERFYIFSRMTLGEMGSQEYWW